MKRRSLGIMLVLMILAVLQGCGQKDEEKTVTAELAFQGVNNYCRSAYDWGVAETNPGIMYLEYGEETETTYQIIFRSYTGAFVSFYVDKTNGNAKMVESVPTLGIEEEAGSINIFDYLDCSASDAGGADYGGIKSDFTGMTPEIAGAYLAVVDEIAAHLGYDEAEGSEGEYLHGGFVRDWDGDGIPELCLLLRTSPRDDGGYEGTPLYGWYAPTLFLYTYRDAHAERAGKCSLYFGTAGREAAVAALTVGDGMRYIWWDHSGDPDETYVDCYALADGKMQKEEAPDDVTDASRNAKTARELLDTLGAGSAQLLLYNNSGEAGIEGAANARELRAALAARM